MEEDVEGREKGKLAKGKRRCGGKRAIKRGEIRPKKLLSIK